MFASISSKYVITPDAIITIISIGASEIPGIPENRKPVPKRYRFELSKHISPIYMPSVTAEAASEGMTFENSFLFPSRKLPVKMPIVIPSNRKNAIIRTAESAET